MPVVAFLLGWGLLIVTLLMVVSALLPLAHGLVPAAAPVAHDASPTRTQVRLALRELEFDHQTGRLAPQDYASSHTGLVAQAASVIQAGDVAESQLSQQTEEAV